MTTSPRVLREVGMGSSSGSGWRAALVAARVEPWSVLPGYAPRLVRPPDEGRCLWQCWSAGGETQFSFRGVARVALAGAREERKARVRRRAEPAGTGTAGSAAERADYALERAAVRHAALRDAGRAAAAAARLGQRRLERRAGVHARVLGCGEQQGGRFVDRRHEHGLRQCGERVR